MNITYDHIRDWYRNNVTRGVAMHGDMLWGYFFVADTPAPFARGAEVLARAGYRYVDVLGEEGSLIHFLHVERVETLTLEQLWARCRELDALAEREGIGEFDGFDVGNVDGSPLY